MSVYKRRGFSEEALMTFLKRKIEEDGGNPDDIAFFEELFTIIEGLSGINEHPIS